MPLYEYKCDKCKHRFELIEKHSATEVKKCPKCGGKAPRQISASGIQFKGSGWYVTDYAKKSSSPASSDSSSDSGSSNSGNSGNAAKSEKAEKSEKAGKPESKSSDSKSSSEKSSSKKDKK